MARRGRRYHCETPEPPVLFRSIAGGILPVTPILPMVLVSNPRLQSRRFVHQTRTYARNRRVAAQRPCGAVLIVSWSRRVGNGAGEVERFSARLPRKRVFRMNASQYAVRLVWGHTLGP